MLDLARPHINTIRARDYAGTTMYRGISTRPLSSSQSRRPKARPTTSSTMSFAMLECFHYPSVFQRAPRRNRPAREEGARHLIRSRADPKGEEVTTFRPVSPVLDAGSEGHEALVVVRLP